ncbi:MAG: S8 family peptidase, partial [Sporichthyaceae bacterium]|nr:S8 family peptidase [Sporichthyaceae bacterium]
MELRLSRLATLACTVGLIAGFGGVPAQAAQAPEGTILTVSGAQAVDGSYIVVFKNSEVSAGNVGKTATALVGRHGGAVGHKYTAALHGFSIRASEQAAKRIAADPRVAYVQQDSVVHAVATQPNPPSWGLDRVDQRNLPLDNSYTYPNTATNVHAYIIDTGIRTTHVDFGGRAVWGTNTTGDGNNTDCNGHGTHVAGTVGGSSYGLAKGVSLTAVKVLNCAGSGTNAGVIAGVDWVTANGIRPAVANMSLGGGISTALDNAVTNSINSGISYAVAAGNSNANACNSSPARTPAAITVGATTITDARASFSNFGTCLDIFAPGNNITSAWSTSNTATNTISGTSMASPHVAGAAALVVSANPSWTAQQVRDFLVNNATTGVVTNPGTGSPNRLLFVVNDGTPPVNDFAIAVNPTSGTVTAGGSTTATVSTATTSGSAQTVTLSASGLPSGAGASFSPPSVTSGGSSTMTITTSTGTAPGNYGVTITGTGTSATHSTPYSLTVNGPGGGCSSPGQKLTNPGFESGSTGWTATSGVIGQWGSAGQPPRSGSWNAWLNGYGFLRTDYVYQQVALPAGCSNYTLSFWLHIDTDETTTTIAYDTLRVQVLNTSGTVLATLATYSNLNAASGYSQKSLSLAAYAGQTIR